MKKIFIILLLAISAYHQSASAAYFQADLATENSDDQIGTHLIIAGRGLEVGDQWLSIAHTQALMFKDKSKHGRIRLISGIDNINTYNTKITKWGYQNIKVYNETMTGSRVVQRISDIEKIASIDFVGHNGAFMGFALEGYSDRFFLSTVDQLATQKSKFTKDSFVRIMGCNTGWKLAPYMAKVLNVPVAGTFTFADVQALFDPATWYYNDVGRFPEGSKTVLVNNVSFKKPYACSGGGGCLRLKPVSIAYAGKHGSYSGTLPFIKYFCGNLDSNECARRAAVGVSTVIGSTVIDRKPSLINYAVSVSEMMCSSWKDLNRRQLCQKNVVNHMTEIKLLNSDYNPIDEPLLFCNFKICAFTETTNDKGQSILVGIKPVGKATTFVDEINFYKNGFNLL